MQMECRSMRWFAAAMAAVCLSACGGGGGDAPGNADGSGGNTNQSPSPSPGPNTDPGGTPPAPPPPGTPPTPPAPPPAGTPPAAPPPGSGTAPIPDPGPGPATPFTLTITSASQRGLKLAWPEVEGADGYRIDRDVDASDGVDNFTNISGGFVFAPGASHTFTQLNLAEALNHTYRVRALSSQGPVLGTATETVKGDLVASIAVETEDPVDDSLDNQWRVMATAFNNESRHVLAVGMPGANEAKGVVRIYERAPFSGGYGPWARVQTLQMPTAQLGDHFGASVSLSPNGQYLAVGIPGDDRPTQGMGIDPTLNAGMKPVEDSGAVQVYRYSGTAWVAHTWFKAINAGRHDAFGTAVAISDEGNLIVGAPNEDSSATSLGTFLPTSADAPELSDDPDRGRDRGAVYTYVNGASGYSFGGYVKPPILGDETTMHFGAAIAIDSLARRVAVGAPRASYDGESAGGVLVYDIAWTLGPPIVSIWTLRRGFGPGTSRPLTSTAENPAFSSDAYRGLGGSLSMSQDGNWLAAGYAYGSKAFLYRNLGGTWSQHSTPASTVPIDGDRFGVSVSLVNGQDGLKLLVGADRDGSRHNGLMRASDIVRDDFVATPESGAAYYFTGRPEAGQPLVLKARLKAPERIPSQMLGQATAMTRDGSELLLSGEYKTGGSRYGTAIFFGY